MRIAAYETLDEERVELGRCASEFNVEIVCTRDLPSDENIDFARGCDAVSIRGRATITADMLSQWRSFGITKFSTRSIGMNHIDLDAARALGIEVCNATYPPNGVAEFTVMLMLMCLRCCKDSLERTRRYSFDIQGLMGRELSSLTVGVVGAGSIGTQVMRILQGFGCTVLYTGRTPKPEADELGRFVPMDELLEQSDIVSLHAALTPETHHLIGADEIARMRDGVIIVNTARGKLIDTPTLEAALASGKIAALGLDTLEGEEVATCSSFGAEMPEDSAWLRLSRLPNVVITPHIAFYTQGNIDSMARNGIEGLLRMGADASQPA